MPVQVSYPGVYIEEIPSGVRTITGVATSITAFVGRALKGPVGKPITINGFGDFERTFGGLWVDGTLSFSVRDFYLNGGAQGVIVRLYKPYFVDDAARDEAFGAATDVAARANSDANTTVGSVLVAAQAEAAVPANVAEPRQSAAKTVVDAIVAASVGLLAASVDPVEVNAVKASATTAIGVAAPITKTRITLSTLNLEAANEGAWGNSLRARVDTDVKGPDAANLFNLSIKDTLTGAIEVIRNVSVIATHSRRVDKVLEQESQLLRIRGALTNTTPTANEVPAAGADPFGASSSVGALAAGLASDGSPLTVTEYNGSEASKTGLFALARTDLFNLLVIPPFSPAADVDKSLWSTAAVYCQKRRAFLLVDSPGTWLNKDHAKNSLDTDIGLTDKNAAIFFPRLRLPNPLKGNQIETFASAGAVAGVMARTDSERGVWKAPAGLDATLRGIPELAVSLNDAENGELNPLGINCLRTMPAVGRVVWGSRTLQGDDRLASEWKYIPVRRTALFLEESLYRGTQWVVFEPNDEPLWAQIRLNLGAFMQNLFRQGAFQGKTPREAYFVKCDKETTTQNDINLGIVNILVGFAPLKPAEFVIIKFQQMAGQIAT